MTAFVSFVQTYAIWLYLLSTLGILLGIKLLFDARRLARTTLFSLDLERANDQTFRALMLIAALLFAMLSVTAVNALLAPLSPGSEPVVLRASTPTLSALVFPSFTPIPSATPTLIRPTETPFYTPTPITPTSTRPAVTATRQSIAPATAIPTAALALPPPMLRTPINGHTGQGEGQANAALTFTWDWCATCVLGPEDQYVLVITFIDKNTNSSKAISSQTRDGRQGITMRSIMRGGTEIYQQSKDDSYQWYVQVKHGDTPLTSPSEVWRFTWR